MKKNLIKDKNLLEDIEVEEGKEMTEGQTEFTTIELIEESEDKKPGEPLKIKGVAAKGGIINGNRRLYSTHVYTKSVEKAQGRLKEGRLLGRLDHPDDINRKSNLTDSAFLFTRLYMEGDLVKYEGRTLPTPKGELLEKLILSGVGVKVSTRGRGDVEYRNMNDQYVAVVQDNFEFGGIDFVLDPSNEFGGIDHYEDQERGSEKMTLEELKVKYPKLVESIQEETRKELEESIKTEVAKELEEGNSEKFATKLDEEVTKAKEETKKEIEESETYQAYTNLVEMVKKESGVAPTDEEVTEKIRLAEEKAEKLEKDLKAVQEEKEKLEKEKLEQEESAKVEQAIEESIKGYEYADILKGHLENCKTVEEVEEQVTEKKNLIESVLVKTGVKKANTDKGGEGNIEEEEENDKIGETLTEEVARQKELAGL